MAKQVFEQFRGLFTSADDFSTPGSPELDNVSIDINNDIRKAKGYTRVAFTTTAITDISAATDAVLTVASSATFSINETLIISGVSDSTYAAVLESKIWKIKSIPSGTTIELDGADTSALATVTVTGTIDQTLQPLTNFSTTGGIARSSLESLGSHYYKFKTFLVIFLSNGTNSWLVKSNPTLIQWSYVETTPTAFNVSDKASFTEYEGNLIFTKNETKTISTQGGTFYWDGSAGWTLAFYGGATNNPTGKIVTAHKERIWVGNLSKIAATSEPNGGSEVMVSKLFPEAIDSVVTQTDFATLTITRGQRTKIEDTNGTPTVDWSSYRVGDVIFIDGANNDMGIDFLNGKFFNITEKSATAIVIDADTSAATTDITTFSIRLRGNTWSPSGTVYDDGLVGAGLFRCDWDTSDTIQQIQPSLHYLTIFREKTVYFFTGSIESGNVGLAKKLNVPYGAVASDIAISSGGIWFVSQYGLSKIEGAGIRTSRSEIDTITTLLPTESIKPTFDAISEKTKLILHLVDRKVWMHDPTSTKTYILDTLNSQWVQHTGKLLDSILDVDEDVYGIHKYIVFKMEDGFNTYDFTEQTTTAISSSYKTKVYDQGDAIVLKDYNMLYALIKGASSTSEVVNLTFKFFFDGSASSTRSSVFNIKSGTLTTWGAFVGGSIWGDLLTAGSTWGDLLGVSSNLFQFRDYRLGTSNQLQIEITHDDASDFTISNFLLDYDLLTIDTN